MEEVNLILTVVCLMLFGLCFLIVIFSTIFGLCRKMELSGAEEDVASPESREERRRERKTYISNALNIKEWVPDDLPVESSEGDPDTPSSEETVEAPQITKPPIKSSPASCAVGSDDCESLVARDEEEMAGCAICLSHFTPQQLVCESNNASCQHVFHKDCMIDWLMKHQDTCPMCREVYVLKTV
jgi:hypothetical protein